MPAPANDNFANAETLTGISGTVTGSNVGATFEVGEPAADDGGEGDDADVSVWYRWTADFAGPATFDTLGSSFDTVLHVYTGASVGSLSLVAANDDGGFPVPNNRKSAVTFTAAAGTTYRIRVNGFSTTGGSTDYGDVVLNWAGPSPYRLVAVGQDGTVVGALSDARLTKVSWELNGPGGAEFTMPTTAAAATDVLPGAEVQVYYQDSTDPLFWGPVVRVQGGLDESTWQCAGLLWYFAHRFMGRADRVNQLTNGGFESSETGWSFSGVTHSVNTNMTYVLEGTKSEKLTGTAADHNTYAYQTWTHPAGGYPGGDALVVSAWVFVPAADYVGGALSDFGLVGIHKRGGATLNAQVAKIDDDTAKDEWVPLEVVLAGVIEGDTIDVLLFPPHGVAYYDLVTLTFMESLSFGYPTAVDASEIIEGIVLYAQDNLAGFTHGKSDLNIGTDIPTIGVDLQRAYQFAEHRNILDALLEFPRMGKVDYDVVLTPTTRTFTAYAPRKGTTYGTTLELDTNVADFSYSWDGEQAASSVILTGPGDGPDRPEGGAVGTDIGGVWSAEVVESAPDDATIGELDARAAEVLKVHQYPAVIEVTTLPGAGVIGNLTIGDFAAVHIDRGWVDIEVADDPPYRVVRIEANLEADQATYTLNRYPT